MGERLSTPDAGLRILVVDVYRGLRDRSEAHWVHDSSKKIQLNPIMSQSRRFRDPVCLFLLLFVQAISPAIRFSSLRPSFSASHLHSRSPKY